MATNFPGSQDSFTNPTSSDTLDSPDHAAQHADVNDAVEAIELALLDGAPMYIDDTNERVGIGTTSPDDELHVVGDVTIEVSDDGSAAQPEVTLHRGSSSPADGDYLGQVKFSGRNDNSQTVNYAKITGKISDASDTTEDGLIEIANIKAGSQSIGYRFTSTDLKLINDRGLQVDGDVGIGTTSPAEELHILKDQDGDLTQVLIENLDQRIRVGSYYEAGVAQYGKIQSEQDNGNNVALSLNPEGGNVGIGTTSPADPLHVADASSADLRLQDTGGTVGAAMSARMLTVDSAGNVQSIVGNSGTSSGVLLVDNIDGAIIMRTQSADSVLLSTNNTTRVTVDSSGDVGIGTTSPNAKLDVEGTINQPWGNSITQDGVNNTEFISVSYAASVGNHVDLSVPNNNGTSGHGNNVITLCDTGRVGINNSNPNAQNGSEYQLDVLASSGGCINMDHATATTTAGLMKGYSNVGGTNTLQFVVRADGDFESRTNSYGSISDQTAKQDIVDAPSQWDDIKAVQLRKYRLIDDVTENGDNAVTQLGVIAQELEASGMGGLVVDADPDNDKQYKTVKYSVLELKALGALQEAMERIESLEARIAVLEA